MINILCVNLRKFRLAQRIKTTQTLARYTKKRKLRPMQTYLVGNKEGLPDIFHMPQSHYLTKRNYATQTITLHYSQLHHLLCFTSKIHTLVLIPSCVLRLGPLAYSRQSANIVFYWLLCQYNCNYYFKWWLCLKMIPPQCLWYRCLILPGPVSHGLLACFPELKVSLLCF